MAPDSEDAILRPYWERLGEFTYWFNTVELRLFHLLCAVAEISPRMGRALFSGTRADVLISSIKRCYGVRGLAIPSYLERALQQASHINSARNDIIHNTTFVLPGEDEQEEALRLVASNRYRTTADRMREVPVGPELVDDLLEDVLTVMAAVKSAEFELNGIGNAEALAFIGKLVDRPWRYKPPAQASPRRAN